MNTSPLFVGIFKFRDVVSPKDLVTEAQKLLSEDENFTRLLIRQTSSDENGICFEYDSTDVQKKYNDDSKLAFDEFFKVHKEYFKQQYGNNFKGWDLSNNPRIIK